MMNIGLIGVGVMGQNLALNIERNGFGVALYDRAREKVDAFLQGKGAGKRVSGAEGAREFLALLERPRRIILLVNAGKPVDDVIADLLPYLEAGDILLDGGNSHFADTERRGTMLAERGVHFVGSGISGGEEGALKGPAIMPGGSPEAYRLLEPVLTTIAAKANGEPCCAYMGPRGAGHYVKMVHNGIEYAIMQLIGETYDVIRSVTRLAAPEISILFGEWNGQPGLQSYLFEITAAVLAKIDPETRRPLVDLILDTAEQKGTGKWTSQNSFDLGTPVPTINAAVEARMLSALKTERSAAARVLLGPPPAPAVAGGLLHDLRDALHASVIASYAQGMALLQAASKEYAYDLRLDRIAGVWRGGCIIRSAMLEPIRSAFASAPALPNLMVDEHFARALNALHAPWRRAAGTAVAHGVPAPAMSASLAYYDAYRAERLPANLLQAQRDYFGAHTYRRVDREGTFHMQWER